MSRISWQVFAAYSELNIFTNTFVLMIQNVIKFYAQLNTFNKIGLSINNSYILKN